MTKVIRNPATDVIVTTLEKLLQMRATILTVLENSQEMASIKDMPDSMLPTSLLYDISVCYELLYEKALEQGLLKIGAHKASKHLH